MVNADRPRAGPEGGQAAFFEAVVRWQTTHGRHGLPWQGTHDPYRVWLSEIMLQQTQVTTVLDYYPRFLARFPDVQTLAAAELDDVLALWSGLGYYSRARNLHACARQVVNDWGGRFPSRAADLQTLQGIGRSTAAAIAAFCYGEPVTILDGNVKRVLSRLLAFEGDLAQAAQERRLWDLAQAQVPSQASHSEMIAYTQGLMDLGATVCHRTRPDCLLCPAADLCEARASARMAAFPVRTRRLVRRTEAWWWLVLRRADGACWVQQRPARGIWAGLYAFPVYHTAAEAKAALEAATGYPVAVTEHPVVRHALTHRDLLLHPLECNWPATHPLPEAWGPGQWLDECRADALGLPTPVRSWLKGRSVG